PLTISLLSSNNDGGISPYGNPWTITRPSTGTATYNFQVTTTDPGIIPGNKTFYVDSANDTPLGVDWAIASSTATSLTVNVIVTDPFNTTSTLSGVTLTK